MGCLSMGSKHICKNCNHWKRKELKVLDNGIKTFGKCKVLSVAGFETLTAWDSTCETEDDINAFEEKISDIQ